MTPSKELKDIGRLALRQEGSSWNAYYALTNTMDGAIPLGSIRLNAVLNNPSRKQVFIEMTRDIIADILEEETGVRPIWGDRDIPPEHEKTGNA